MTSPTEPRTAELYHGAVDPPIAALVVAAAMGTFLVAGALAPPGLAVVFGQLALLATAAATAVMTVKLAPETSPWRVVGLARPRPPMLRVLAGAVLLGGSLWFLNLYLVAFVERHLGVVAPAQLAIVVERDPLPITLLMLAVLPPIAEELIFRGVFARALAHRMPSRLGRAIAVLGSAAVFSFYHLSPIQTAPTFVIGTALALVALRADSIVPAIALHSLNNAIAIVVARDAIPGAGEFLGAHQTAMTIGCSVATLGGILLVVL